jgi:hypothetical protein
MAEGMGSSECYGLFGFALPTLRLRFKRVEIEFPIAEPGDSSQMLFLYFYALSELWQRSTETRIDIAH